MAFKMSFPSFIVPFFFASNPVLLGQGVWHEVLRGAVTAVWASSFWPWRS